MKIQNKKKLINYLNTYGGYSGKQWIKINKKNLFSNKKKILKELYIPRVMMNFWMLERFISSMKELNKICKTKNILIDIKFFKGEVNGLKKKKKFLSN